MNLRYMDDLRLLPLDRSFVLSDCLAGWTGGRANYWKQRGLIRQVGIVFKGMPAPLWLTMQLMRSWSFADRDAITKAERRAQLKMLNREWREDDEIVLEQEEERAVQEARA